MANQIAEIKTYKSVHEKYEDVSKNARIQRGMSWYINPAMDKTLPDGHFTLIQIPDAQFARNPADGEVSPWKEQGYIPYKPAIKVESPAEAKKVESTK